MQESQRVTAWAERLLSGTGMEDKLAPIPRREERAAVERGPRCLPEEPGRPPGLRLPSPGARSRGFRPRMDAIGDDRERGRLLHAFANHELMAIELLALGLLRFPGAPARWRAEVVATIRDEQRHLELYIARMKELGVPWGSLPVSRYFWDAVRDVRGPDELVARLGLTLEQANLDHALVYGRAFAVVGDESSHAIMDRILRDEVRHVHHGLRWLMRWRSGGEPLWEAWEGRLGPILMPADARGPSLHREPREAAGLPVEFIDRLGATSRAKRRRPVVWWFNPACEDEIRRGEPAPTNSGPADDVARDLESLLAWIAAPGDVLLAREEPDFHSIADRTALGMPALRYEPVAAQQLRARGPRPSLPVIHERLAGLAAWGPSPSAAHVLAPLRERVVNSERGASLWRESWRSLFDKTRLPERRNRVRTGLIARGASPESVLPEEALGRAVTEPNALLGAAERLSAQGFEVAILKAPLSQSGRHRRRVPLPLGAEEQRTAIAYLEREKVLLIEPWFERIADFSLHFEVEGDARVRPIGAVRTTYDGRGAFRAACLHPSTAGLGSQSRRMIHDLLLGRRAPLLAALSRELGELSARARYMGPMSVDVMLVRTPTGRALHPLLEINPRFTMGRVALALARRVRPGTPATWCHVALGRNAETTRQRLTALAEPIERDENGTFQSGTLLTNPAQRARRLITILAVGRRAVERLSPECRCDEFLSSAPQF